MRAAIISPPTSSNPPGLRASAVAARCPAASESHWFTSPKPTIRACGWCLDTALHAEGIPIFDATVDMGAMGLEYRWACSWHRRFLGEDWFGRNA